LRTVSASSPPPCPDPVLLGCVSSRVLLGSSSRAFRLLRRRELSGGSTRHAQLACTSGRGRARSELEPSRSSRSERAELEQIRAEPVGSALPLRGEGGVDAGAERPVRTVAAKTQLRVSKDLNSEAGGAWCRWSQGALARRLDRPPATRKTRKNGTSCRTRTTGTRRFEVARAFRSSNFESPKLAPHGVDRKAGRRAELERADGA